MTIQLTQDAMPQHESVWRSHANLAGAVLRGCAIAVREHWRLAGAWRKRRRMLRALRPLDDRIRILSELAATRAELEFTYRNNLDRH